MSVRVNADRSNNRICLEMFSVTQNLEKMSFMYRLLRLYLGNCLEVGVVTCRVFVVLLVLERLSLAHTPVKCIQVLLLPSF